MRVTYSINARLAAGGIGNIAENAVRAAFRQGWLSQLFVSSSRTHEFDSIDIRSMGLAGRALKRISNYDSSGRLYWAGDVAFDRWAAMQLNKCDIFHGWNNHALHSLAVAHRSGATTIVERPGSHILQSDRLLQEEFGRWGWQEPGILPATLSRCLQEYDTADYIMVPSQYNFDSFVREGVSRHRLLLLPMGVDVNRFVPVQAAPAKPFRVLFVGQVTLRKGIPYVLEAWRKAHLSNAELILAGEIKADARKAIEPYRTDTSIRWMGYIKDPVALYQSAHVFVFPSIDEGSALVTYEAMACGLPCIVTDNAGSLVRDGIDGWIVPAANSDAVTDRLYRLYLDPSLRETMGQSARKAIEPVTWDRYGERLLMVYQSVLGQN